MSTLGLIDKADRAPPPCRHCMPGFNTFATRSLPRRAISGSNLIGSVGFVDALIASAASRLERCWHEATVLECPLNGRFRGEDARPLTIRSSISSCYARPDHTFGQSRPRRYQDTSAMAAKPDVKSSRQFRHFAPEADMSPGALPDLQPLLPNDESLHLAWKIEGNNRKRDQYDQSQNVGYDERQNPVKYR